MHRPFLILAILLLTLTQVGCLKRTISITTEPEGALVWLNDVEVGRTPLETDFNYYGTYDVRIHREGYEPIVTKAKADQPIQEYPGIDLAAEAIPATLSTTVQWHWTLTSLPELGPDKAQAERRLIDRAKDLKDISSGHPAERVKVDVPAEPPVPPSAQPPQPPPATAPAP